MPRKPPLRALLRKAGKSQTQLANALRAAAATVSRYCDGLSVPDAATARKIARFVGVRVEELGLRERRSRGPKTAPGRLNWKVVTAALKKRGLSITELAVRVGGTRQSFYRAKDGVTSLRLRTLQKMAAVLAVPIKRLIVPTPAPAPRSPATRRAR